MLKGVKYHFSFSTKFDLFTYLIYYIPLVTDYNIYSLASLFKHFTYFNNVLNILINVGILLSSCFKRSILIIGFSATVVASRS